MKSFTIRIWKYASVWFSQFCTKKEREQGSNEISRGQVTRRQRPTTYYKTFQLSLTKKAVREAAANLVVDTVWSDRFKWKSIQRAITDINRKRGTLVSTLKSVWNSIKWGREHWSLWKQQLKALKLSSSKTDLRVCLFYTTLVCDFPWTVEVWVWFSISTSGHVCLSRCVRMFLSTRGFANFA